MTEMANQIKVCGVYHSQKHSISRDANYFFFSNMAILREREREREKRERGENCKRPSLSTSYEANNEFNYLKYSIFTTPSLCASGVCELR